MKRHKPVLLVKFGVRENLASRLYFLRLALDSRLDDENAVAGSRIPSGPRRFFGAIHYCEIHTDSYHSHQLMLFAADTSHGGAL